MCRCWSRLRLNTRSCTERLQKSVLGAGGAMARSKKEADKIHKEKGSVGSGTPGGLGVVL